MKYRSYIVWDIINTNFHGTLISLEQNKINWERDWGVYSMDRKHMNMMTRESINIMVILMMGYPNAIDIELHKSSISKYFFFE